MEHQKFEEVVNDTLDKCKKILYKKTDEYTTGNSKDRLHNFNIAAGLENTTPIGALAGMMAKHTVSVYDMCRGDTDGKSYPSELWDEKIIDNINYLILLRVAVAENNNYGENKNEQRIYNKRY